LTGEAVEIAAAMTVKFSTGKAFKARSTRLDVSRLQAWANARGRIRTTGSQAEADWPV
jgi:hypothetical protein